MNWLQDNFGRKSDAPCPDATGFDFSVVSAETLTAWEEGLTDAERHAIVGAVGAWPEGKWTEYKAVHDELDVRMPGLPDCALALCAYAAIAGIGPFAKSADRSGRRSPRPLALLAGGPA